LRSGISEQLNEMTLRQHNWTLGAYCQTYCRVVNTHHTFEDIGMLPALREADPGWRRWSTGWRRSTARSTR
jgi:hypothetical protein